MQNSLRRYALLGMPLSHSVSPHLHRALMRLKGLDGAYTLWELSPEELNADTAAQLRTLQGFNVTLPHKVGILQLLDDVSETAALCGSVNTVDVKNGRMIGHNTDKTGFLRALERASMSVGDRVLIYGCGGAARMFAFTCAQYGAAVTLAVRAQSTEKATTLCREVTARTGAACGCTLLNEVYGAYDMIINATPLGMFPAADACPAEEGVIARAGAVFDAVYRPCETRLLQLAKKHGVAAQNGLWMLVYQAAAAQELWNGVTFTAPETERAYALVQKELMRHE